VKAKTVISVLDKPKNIKVHQDIAYIQAIMNDGGIHPIEVVDDSGHIKTALVRSQMIFWAESVK